MQHPFTWLPSPYRWALLAALFAGAAAFALVLRNQGKPLETPAVPGGILSYEFAWGRARAETILVAWGPLKDTARQQLLLDSRRADRTFDAPAKELSIISPIP